MDSAPPSSGKRPGSATSSASSTDSGIESGVESSPTSSAEVFGRGARLTEATPQVSEAKLESLSSELSYKDLKKRDVDEFYVAKEDCAGWPADLKTLYKNGEQLCAAFNALICNLSNIIQNSQSDRSLQQLLVLFGHKAVGGDTIIQVNQRDALRTTMKQAGFQKQWTDIEDHVIDALSNIPFIAYELPLLDKKLEAAEKTLGNINSDNFRIIKKVESAKKSGKNASLTFSEKRLVKKRQKISKETETLRQELKGQMDAKTAKLKPLLDKLEQATNNLSESHLTKFRPCTEAARSNVKVLRYPSSPDDTRDQWEQEKTSGALRLGCSALPSKLEHFAKSYFTFYSESGREKRAEKHKSTVTESRTKQILNQSEVSHPPPERRDSGFQGSDD